MPPTSGTYEMADRLTGGNLVKILRKGRTAKESYNAIARRLFADYGVTVATQTVANWCDVLEAEGLIPEREQVAS